VASVKGEHRDFSKAIFKIRPLCHLAGKAVFSTLRPDGGMNANFPSQYTVSESEFSEKSCDIDLRSKNAKNRSSSAAAGLSISEILGI
jgi:hypothetical protein